LVLFYYLRNLDQCSGFGYFILYHRRHSEQLFFLKAFADQLFITVFKNMKIDIFPGIHHNFKGKYGNKVCHSFKAKVKMAVLYISITIPLYFCRLNFFVETEVFKY